MTDRAPEPSGTSEASDAKQAPEQAERVSKEPPNAELPERRNTAPTFGVPAIVASFEERRRAHEDLDFDGLVRELGAARAPEAQLGFAPHEAKYYDETTRSLQLTPEEDALFRKNGFVEVDHQKPYSMASAYYAIYTRDLPVLITTDSILYAWHRSFDNALAAVESSYLAHELRAILGEAHEELRTALPRAGGNTKKALVDADLYLTVALNLLEGAGSEKWKASQPLAVESVASQDSQVRQILTWVQKRTLQKSPFPKTPLFGQERYVDYTQFVPRGHYTKSEALKRYFRAMMWLGRADTGVLLSRPPAGKTLTPAAREAYREALTLSALLTGGDRGSRLALMRALIDRLVGSSTALSPEQLAASGLPLPVTNAVLDSALPKALAAGGQNLIRSRTIYTSPDMKAPEEPLLSLFQVFSQRFTLDSFFTSKLVFDSIRYQGRKVERRMPQGRDVMAALGNDEALFQLEESLDQYKYAANLLAARQIVDEYTEGDWAQSIYNHWLSTLRTLDDVPEGPFAPQVMKSRLWQQKQLETQISSWANLRHDTVLYTQQSYTAGTVCEYPTGYVEPYPEFYRRMGEMAGPVAQLLEDTSKRLAGFDEKLQKLSREERKKLREKWKTLSPTEKAAWQAKQSADGPLRWIAAVFRRFEETSVVLERLARKELAGQPFTNDERFFLKQTIDERGGGSGPPTYSGWYAALIYGEEPPEFNPTVSDVHTDPIAGQVLQVGVGAATFLLAAIDNGSDRMVYVGPKYTYYEFSHSAADRLTDEAWERMLLGKSPPERPSWSSGYRAAPKARVLEGKSEIKPEDSSQLSAEERRKRWRKQYEEKKNQAEAERKARGGKNFGALPTEH